ncbi:MAG: fenitrothion hydrolase [Gaiellaceae bacterium]
MSLVLAHGLGGVKDLPVPLWLFYYGAALVLILSFIALWVLWKRPLLERASRGRALPGGLENVLRSRVLRLLAGAVFFALFVLVWVAAAIGDSSPDENLAPRFVFVVFWLGLPALSVLFGNVWTVLSPWRAAADSAAWMWERAGLSWVAPFAYPQRLGRWPGAVLLFAFAALELAYWDPGDPRALALAIFLYSAITWLAMLAYGRDEWTENGEAFAVYFGLLAPIAPFGERDERLIVRWPFTGLTGLDPRPGTLAFVAVMLGSVAFDGFSQTEYWAVDFRARLMRPVIQRSPDLADVLGALLAAAGLALMIVLVALAYIAAMKIAARAVDYDGDLTDAFLGSLVPIALAYVVAHYFSFFVRELQYLAPFASDPFGFGWDLFGTADVTPRITVIAPKTIWYAQVAALVVGHVAGLVLAHDKAVELFESPRKAAISQYAMLALMVVYTVAGLWLLSQ